MSDHPRRNQLPFQPPRRAPSSSNSAQSNTYLTPNASHESAENPALSLSLSPSSLNPQTTESGYSGGSEQSRRTSQQTLLGQPIVQEPQNPESSHFGGYGFPPGGQYFFNPDPAPAVWGYGTYYEPQGELQAQLQARQIPPEQEFASPFPIRAGNIASGYDSQISRPASRAESISMPAATQTQTYDMSGRQQPSSIITTRAGQKRKADGKGEVASDASPTTQSATSPSAAKRPSVSRPAAQAATVPPGPRSTRSQQPLPPTSDAGRTDDDPEETVDTKSAPARGKQSEKSVERRIAEVSSRLTTVLPAGKVFPIQIGSDLFRLSGASISSDAPSYFSHYFGEQLIQTVGRASQVKTLYIDRDPSTFRDIALHLQGYYVKPHDEEHFVRLFADAQFYSLPRLTQQLFKSEIFIQVGERHFQIPRDTFSSPGDSPNFFSLGFAHFFSTPSEVFPGLDRQTLLRPPSILPPAIANRSGDVFADLLRILQGYDVHIRDAGHRAELLRDAKYFHLKGVEQKLIPHDISQNLVRGRSEISLRLEDVRQSGVNFHPDRASSNPSVSSTSKPGTPHSATDSSAMMPIGWVTYQRPYVDDTAHDLVLEVSAQEATRLDLATMRAAFSGQTKARVASLFSVIANKLNLPAMMPLGLMMMQSGGGIAAQPASPANSGVSEDKVRVRIEKDAFIQLDGEPVEWDDDNDEESSDEDMSDIATDLPGIRKWIEGRELRKELEWIIRKAQWRIRVERADDADSPGKVEVVLCAVRLEGYTREMYRNRQKGFLT